MKDDHIVYYNTLARKPRQEKNEAATCHLCGSHFVCLRAFLPNSTVLFDALTSLDSLAACHGV